MDGRASPSGRRVNPSGLLVAGVGFFLTRFTVTLVATDDAVRFLLGGVLPLALGLAVAAYGVALTVGDFEPGYVRTVALWCVAGTAGIGVFVWLTLYAASPDLAMETFSVSSGTRLSNLLIGGCVGGTITGIFAARNRRRRLERTAHAKRMVVLNHLLRDAVFNALTAIRGRVQLLGDDEDAATRERAVAVIDEQTAGLEDSVEEIRHLARGDTDPGDGLEAIRLDERLAACVADARERFPDAEIEVEGDLPPITVRADALLGRVFERLIENAVIHSDAETPRVTIDVERAGGAARVSIADNGPGLPVAQRTMLAEGTVDQFDDPSTGFGLNVATLLTESYRGGLDATVTEAGTTIDVTLPVHGDGATGGDAVVDGDAAANGDVSVDRAGATATGGVPKRRLVLAGGAALVAGAVMGLLISALGGAVPVIGSLYGVADPVVGWLTHQFHSVVFGLVYLVLLAVAPWGLARHHAGRIAVGVAWGVALWLVAAGVVMPLWLQLVGFDATVPSLQVRSLIGHVVWGLVLGAVYSLALSAEIPDLPGWGDWRPRSG